MARAHDDYFKPLRDRRKVLVLEPMKNRIFDWMPVLQVLNYNSLQELGSDVGVPDSLRVYDHDRSVTAHAEAWCFAALHAPGPEQQILALQ